MICKTGDKTGDHNYQLTPGEFPLAANCSEKEESSKISFL